MHPGMYPCHMQTVVLVVPCVVHTEFIRVPGSMVHSAAAVRRACAPYNAAELSQWGIALGAQIMGCQPQLLATAAAHLSTVQGAPRVDLNCGCPANRVTGAGAGSR